MSSPLICSAASGLRAPLQGISIPLKDNIGTVPTDAVLGGGVRR